MKRTLHSGPVPTRYVYRWMREMRRGGPFADFYFTIDGPLYDSALAEAINDLDMYCKTLYCDTSTYEARTRYWFGRERFSAGVRRAGLHPGQPNPGRYILSHDRKIGLRYARLIANVLRVAHEEGWWVLVHARWGPKDPF